MKLSLTCNPVSRRFRERENRLCLERLEPRVVLDAQVIISEFLAKNDVGHKDDADERSDWIELFNAGDESVNLQGYHLTDDAADLDKWTFPNVLLPAREYLVVYASGNNLIDPSSQLHTNFRLSSGGEYLALVAPDGETTIDHVAPEFPVQRADVSFGITQQAKFLTWIEPGGPARWLVPSRANGGDELGTQWTSVEFDDAGWNEGTNDIGFEGASGFRKYFSTDLERPMQTNTTAYLRVPFEVSDVNGVYALTLGFRYDDGYVAYLNGVEVDRRNAPEEITWQADAVRTHRDAFAVQFEDVDLLSHRELLREGNNVLAVHAMNSDLRSNDFLFVPRLMVNLPGDVTSLQRGYLAQPTPGIPNGDQILTELVSSVEIDVERGFFDAPFDVQITNDTPGASIVYTLDGSAPTPDNGIVVSPADETSLTTVKLSIDRTTTLRAVAVKQSSLSTRPVTRTYLFADDIASQTYQDTIDAGFPETWGGTAPDYGIDPDVVGENDLFDGIYAAQFVDSLKSVPTLSLVMDRDDLFDPEAGIYANTTQSGREWERPVSVELIYPDGATGFQIDAGVRILGGFSRRASRKNSLRLEFRGEYGTTNLRYPLFGDGAVDEFDTLVLRAGFNDAWVWTPTSTHYVRDMWTRETQRAMGHLSSHGTFMHVYINGRYWGLYNPSERPDAAFLASYFGGDESEYDALNVIDPVNGTVEAWLDLSRASREVSSNDEAESNAALLRLMGRGPDGKDDPNIEALLDLENYNDYMILNIFSANNDWPSKNYYTGRRRGPESEGFQFYSWDAERSLNDEEGAHVNLNQTRVSTGSAAFYQRLFSNDEYRLMFADRLHRHFFNGGVLYVDPEHPVRDPAHPERNVPAARYARIADQIELPLVAESARWGDARRTELALTIADRRALLDEMFKEFLSQRSSIVLNQFIDRGLYPELAAPVFHQHGGTVEPGFALTMNAPGTIYFTTDGSDPRASVLDPGIEESGISLTARVYQAPVDIDKSMVVKARTFVDGVWSALNEANFTTGVLPLRVSELMYHPSDGSNEALVDGDYEFIELSNISSSQFIELAGVAFTDGVQFVFSSGSLGPGERIVVVSNQVAFQERYGTDVSIAGEYVGSQLSNAGETIRLEDAVGSLIQEFSYDDQWYPVTDGQGQSLTAVDLSANLDRWNRADGWRVSSRINGTPGNVESELGDFDGDGRVDIRDVDLFCAAYRDQDAAFDLTGDGAVDDGDLSGLVNGILGTTFGDANLDGRFDSEDLQRVFEAGEYLDSKEKNSRWSTGDWNCDGEFDTEDIVLAFTAGGYQR